MQTTLMQAENTTTHTTETTVSSTEWRFDLLVVGHGLLAEYAARRGLDHGRVLLVSPGSGAVDAGCFESLRAFAKRRHAAGEASRPLAEDAWRAALAQCDENVAWSPGQGDVERAGGEFRFVAPQRAAITKGSLHFRRAILFPPSRRLPPDWPGTAECGFLSAENLAALRTLPRRMAVAGDLAEGCAWAQVFARLGCETHLLVGCDATLEHPMVEQALLGLPAQGIRLHRFESTPALSPMGNCKVLRFAQGSVDEKLLIDALFWCGPRQFDAEAWDLSAAGIRRTTAGIALDRYGRSTNPHVFVAGDDDAAALENGLGQWPLRPAWDGPRVEVVRTDPEYVVIAARRPRDIGLAAGSLYRCELGSAGAGGPAESIELSVDGVSGCVARAAAVGHDARRWLAPVMLLMRQGRPLCDLLDTPLGDDRYAAALRQLAARQALDWHARFGAGWLGTTLSLYRRARRLGDAWWNRAGRRAAQAVHSIQPPPSTRGPS